MAGDSATATAAAWANLLLAPVTKVSKVYLGFSRAASIVVLLAPGGRGSDHGAGEEKVSPDSTGGGAYGEGANGSCTGDPAKV